MRPVGSDRRPERTVISIGTGSSSSARRAPTVRSTLTPRAPATTQPAATAASTTNAMPGTYSGSASNSAPVSDEGDAQERRWTALRARPPPHSAGVAASASATTRSPVSSMASGASTMRCASTICASACTSSGSA